jgi:hypothetical protein
LVEASGAEAAVGLFGHAPAVAAEALRLTADVADLLPARKSNS